MDKNPGNNQKKRKRKEAQRRREDAGDDILNGFDRVKRELFNSGFSKAVLSKTLRLVQLKYKEPEFQEKLVKAEISKRMGNFLRKPELYFYRSLRNMKVVMVVGLPGAGKTTVCLQLARYCQDRLEISSGIVCASDDRSSYRYLRKRAAGNNIHGRSGVTGGTEQILEITREGLERFGDRDIIIIDTPRAFLSDDESFRRLARIAKCAEVKNVFLVWDATHNGFENQNSALGFKKVKLNLTGIIATNIDGEGAGKGAVVFNVAAALDAPLKFVSSGPASDLETDSTALVQRLFA